MKKLLTIVLVALLASCTNQVKKTSQSIKNDFDENYSGLISDLSESMYFIYYANPANYWYPETYTDSDIMQDKFKIGIEGLVTLGNDISKLPTNDPDISSQIQLLQNAIEQSKKDLKETQKSLERVDFALMDSGGLFGLMALESMLGGGESSQSELPSEVKDQLQELVNTYYNKMQKLCYTARDPILRGVLTDSVLTTEEAIEVRNEVKAHLKSKFEGAYPAEYDTEARDEYISIIFDCIDDK